MTHPILVALDLPSDLQQKIQSAAGPNPVTFQSCRTAQAYTELGERNCEVLLSRFALPDSGCFPRLKWVQTCGAGVDHLATHPLIHADVTFTTASGVHAACISELVFAFILHFQRNLPKIRSYASQRKWPAQNELFEFFDRPDLDQQSLMVIGLGSIGRRVARLGRTFGMRVLGIKRDPASAPELRYLSEKSVADAVFGIGEMPEIVPQADYLILCLPLTAETRGLINRHILDRMKRSAILINVGRGALIDEAALVESLRNGGIAGAGLDCFAAEPLPPEHPFYEMENVIVSPHVGGATRSYDARVVDIFAENIQRYLAGEPLLNRVDWGRGY
jgi:phosphoglycerate dehydrogenase-like enzyme